MKTQNLLLLSIVSSLFTWNTSAAVRYVNAASTNAVAPFATWSTAASNIQSAVGGAQNGDVILVTNGVYNTGGRAFSGSSNRVALDSVTLTIESVNGPGVTSIEGYQMPVTTNGVSAVRCIYLTDGSILSGFTLTNGATALTDSGGGVKCQTVNAVVSNCVVVGNSADSGGAGAYMGTLVNCSLVGNSAPSTGGGFGGGANNSVLINCLIAGNNSSHSGGGTFNSTLINCTVVTNTSSNGGGTSNGTNENSIIYYNSPNNLDPGKMTNCCTIPAPISNAANIITNAPLFVNLAASDFHLQPNSPCINAGQNGFITNTVDLDGKPRVVAGTVDLGAFEFPSLIHFVSLSSLTPISPYTNWTTAATNIQDAIDASVAGDLVLVSNGTYNVGARIVYGASSNRVVINKAITVESLSGPASTIIAGFHSPTAAPQIRCAYLTNGAALFGFTLTNGSGRTAGDPTNEESGGGVWCESTSAIISNCVLIASAANNVGGGAYQGTFYNCTLSNNIAGARGGGAFASILNNCLVSSNRAAQSAGGGAAFGTLSNCLLTFNATANNGGGTYFSTVYSCTFSNNVAEFGGGTYGGTVTQSLISSNGASNTGGGAYSNTLNDCIVFTNHSQLAAGGAFGCTLNNCTILANNTAGNGGGVDASTANNCIIFFNRSSNGVNSNYLVGTLIYCDTAPLPPGVGNITNPPVFINFAPNDFHQQSNSPTINSGDNSFVTTATDFDGNSRIAGGTVDMGAYEFQMPTSIISYAWLQEFGLPTDGSADFIDSDGDGMNNWAEWRAGTNPTNALSLLEANPPAVNASGVTITWQSETNITYYVQRTADLTTLFSSIQSNIVGQVGTTSYIDTNTSSASFYYRVGVQ